MQIGCTKMFFVHLSSVFRAILLCVLFRAELSVFASDSKQINSLRLVHVIFRHGARTNDGYTTYPKDPHINETYYPYGLGELTDKGKDQVRLLGEALHKRYGNFLGETYSPDIFSAVSTQLNRTKQSLEIVLAGLLFPSNKYLNTSIPYECLSLNNQTMAFSLYRCPKYSKLLQNYLNSSDGVQRLQQYLELFQYLSENTGRKVNSIFDIYAIHLTLKFQEEWGFELPPWTKSVYPKHTKKGAIDQYLLSAATTELKQLSGGFLLKKIIQNIQLKIDGMLIPHDRKIFMYSGHEYNIAHLLIAMEVFVPHIPPPSAHILIELHEIDSDYGVKIFYQDYTEAKPKLLQVPSCNRFCPFTKFIEILKTNIPVNNNACHED